MAKRPHTGSVFTADFRQEFDVETDRLLRQRFLWFAGLLSAYALATSGFYLLMIVLGRWARSTVQASLPPSAEEDKYLGALISGLVGLIIFGWCFFIAKRRHLPSASMLRLTFLMVVADGVWRVIAPKLGIGSFGMLGTLITHVLACSFLPWTMRQAVIPLIPIFAVYAIRVTVFHDADHDWNDGITWIIASLFIAAPGLLICLYRHDRRMELFRMNFMQRRYGEVRRELVDARRIHEALFPRPIDAGPVRFCYEYEPMRQIGGDYLYACTCDDIGSGPADLSSSGTFAGQGQSLNVVVMDVTGHGIPAALTVNRLYGELRRIFAENPAVLPGEVMRLLNRYVNLTLADHSLYVTAMCIRVDSASDQLHYASAGHPPAYIRAVDGTVHELPATTWLLGATDDATFDCSAATHRFGPGDTLIAYTDGVIESRAKDGRFLGMDGLRQLLADPNRVIEGAWPRRVLERVTTFRFGPPQDDALVIEVTRPIGHTPTSAPANKPATATAGR